MGCCSSGHEVPVDQFHQKYVFNSKVECGAHGSMRIARLRNRRLDQTPVAVKVVGSNAINDAKIANATRGVLKNEAMLLSRVGNHANVIKLHETFFEEKLCYFVFEAAVVCLADQVDKLLERDLGCHVLFRDMLSAISHVHAAGIVHRNIAFRSFVLSSPDSVNVKLANFKGAVSMPSKGCLVEVEGEPVYCSPEMLAGGYGFKTDVWSFGVMAYMLLFVQLPFDPLHDTFAAMRKAFALHKQPSYQSPGHQHNRLVVEFVQALLDREVSSRSDADEALALPYLKDVDPMTGSEYKRRKEQVLSTSNIATRVRRARRPSLEPGTQKDLDKTLEKLQAASRPLSSFQTASHALSASSPLRRIRKAVPKGLESRKGSSTPNSRGTREAVSKKMI